MSDFSKWNPLRLFWFVLGCIALMLAALGVPLPVLPTTPFVILAAFAFGKSSPRLQAWLESSKTFGPMITEWRAHGAIAPRYKAIATGMMAAVFLLSLIMGVPAKVIAIQAVCLGGAAVFILTRPHGPDNKG